MKNHRDKLRELLLDKIVRPLNTRKLCGENLESLFFEENGSMGVIASNRNGIKFIKEGKINEIPKDSEIIAKIYNFDNFICVEPGYSGKVRFKWEKEKTSDEKKTHQYTTMEMLNLLEDVKEDYNIIRLEELRNIEELRAYQTQDK